MPTKADRLVIDSNVLISALLSPSGTPRRLLHDLSTRNATLLFSDATFVELATRLARSKFDRYRSREQLEAFLDWLAEIGEWVAPTIEVTACRDPEDNKFLSLALAGEADCLVTGDDDLLILNPFEGVPVLAPRAVLEWLRVR